MDSIIEKDCLEVLQHNDLSDLTGKTFFITGSNGLIGNYFATLLDLANRKFNTHIKAYCISKHSPIWTNETFSFVTQDMSSPFLFEHQVDYIIHGACYAQPSKFVNNELETIALNVDATHALLEVAKNWKAKLLLLSSSEVYGNPPSGEIPTKETYPGNSLTSNTRAAYVQSKKLGETLCFSYHRNFQVEAKIARLGPIYGPGISINDERVMGNFMKKAIIDKHIKLMDEGKSLRTYCYITDALNMMLKIMLQGKEVLYNVGGIETVSIYEMAQLIARFCGATCEVSSGKGLKDAPDIVKLDVSKVCNEFGINKFTPFKEGLKRTIDWNLSREK